MITDTKCRNAKPDTKAYKLTDDKGLYLEVKPNGVKTWRYRFETLKEGKRCESSFTIGEYGFSPAGEAPEQAKNRRDGGVFTLAEAREERAKARALVKQGISPVQNRTVAKLKSQFDLSDIFDAFAEDWIKRKDWEVVTKNRRLNMLTRVVFPDIGKMPLRQIAPAQVLEVLTKAAQNNGITVKDEAKRTLYGIFEFALEMERVDSNPVRQWRGVLPANKTQHKRPLSKLEIGQLMRDLSGYDRNFQTVAAFHLMWFTLCRPSEVTGARWSEIDLEGATWTIPAERMKKRKAHTVPLPCQAIELLRRVMSVTGHREYVFPNRDDRTKPMDNATLRQALKCLNWATKYSPHATRTTGSTRLKNMNFNSEWIERQFAHAIPNKVSGTYDHAEHFEDRIKMMQHWADYLDEQRDGTKILP